jgi:hypothetical protein
MLAIIPVYQRPSDDELIDEAYGVAIQKIFLIYAENMAIQDDATATARFKKSLAQTREARTKAHEVAAEQ